MKFAAQAYILFVKDMDQLSAFYTQAFGFKKIKNGGDACDARDPEGNAFQLQGPATKPPKK